MTLGTKIVLILILVHLIIGFGYMVYLMMPKKKNDEEEQ
jgi:Tfp pilus assembly protein PilO